MTIQFRKLLTIYSRYYIKAVLGISDIVESVRELSAAYRQSLEAVEYRFYGQKSDLLQYCEGGNTVIL